MKKLFLILPLFVALSSCNSSNSSEKSTNDSDSVKVAAQAPAETAVDAGVTLEELENDKDVKKGCDLLVGRYFISTTAGTEVYAYFADNGKEYVYIPQTGNMGAAEYKCGKDGLLEVIAQNGISVMCRVYEKDGIVYSSNVANGMIEKDEPCKEIPAEFEDYIQKDKEK